MSQYLVTRTPKKLGFYSIIAIVDATNKSAAVRAAKEKWPDDFTNEMDREYNLPKAVELDTAQTYYL